MPVLIDTSVWIDYFRTGLLTHVLDPLLSENQVLTNDLILAELLPYLEVRRQNSLITLLKQVERLPLEIDWEEIINLQVCCLKNGFNGLGIPDLIIAQIAMQHSVPVLSRDKHFQMLKEAVGLEFFPV